MWPGRLVRKLSAPSSSAIEAAACEQDGFESGDADMAQHSHARWYDDGNGGPWWSKMIVRYGIGTAFAAVLLWAFLYRVDGELEAMRVEHQMLMFYGRAQCLNLARIVPPDERTAAREDCQPPFELVEHARETGSIP